jgi:hypothetical protein
MDPRCAEGQAVGIVSGDAHKKSPLIGAGRVMGWHFSREAACTNRRLSAIMMANRRVVTVTLLVPCQSTLDKFCEEFRGARK